MTKVRNRLERLAPQGDDHSESSLTRQLADGDLAAGDHALAPVPALPVAELPVLDLSADFDEELYLILNPDIADAVQNGVVPSGAWHWQRYGCLEEKNGQRPSIQSQLYYTVSNDHLSEPPTADELADFDARFYLDTNPDVAAALDGLLERGLDHWVKHGRFEGRLGSRTMRARPRAFSPARMMDRPFGINLFAPFSAQSGLGTAARGYLRALRAVNIPVHLVNLNLTANQFSITARDYDHRPPYRISVFQVNADTVDRFLRLFRRGWFDDTYCIAIWAWELNVLRPDWFTTFREMDEVWTLSHYITDAVAAVAPIPVQTVNVVVGPASSAEYDRAYFDLPSGFLFLIAFDVGSSLLRKNPLGVLDAFIEAFGDRTDVHLVMKFHSAQRDLGAVQAMLGRAREVANVIIRSEVLRDDEMRGLQACADCLVSAHRSEGFGLNLAEFMLTGKPVITTAYSGNMDFTEPDNSYLVPFTLALLAESSGPYLPGYQWAEPDHAALVAQMRRVVAQPAEAREIGARGAETVRTRLSARAIGQQIMDRLDALGLRAPLPGFMLNAGRSAGIEAPLPEVSVPVTDPAQHRRRPTISIIVPVYNVPPEYLVACIESVRAQTYPHWELCLCNDASTSAPTLAALARYQGIDPRIRIKHLPKNQGISAASNAAAHMATGSYLLMLDNDDTLTTDAISEVAAAVIRDPAIDALYSDEDKLDPFGRRCDTYHKPDWSPEHLESVMYTLHPLTIRTSLFLELGGFRAEFSGAQDWDLMLRVSRATSAIHHIPKILYHWRMIPGSASAEVAAKPEALHAAARALADHVAAKYGPGNAAAEPAPLAGHYRVRHSVRGTPPVTLLITTNNAELQLPGRKPFVMVRNLVQSILDRTDYANYRIMVVDNANTPDGLRRWLTKAGVALRSFTGPTKPFNYPSKANFAVRQLETEHVVLMNDDMEVINTEWLSALLEFSQQPGVGACGSKLLHADGTIQHVGTVLGVNGGSAHVYHGFPGDFVGYNGYTHVIRNYSALTGACLATRRSVIAEVGGWDTRLAIDFNDIDLCLRMRQHGYRIVYTPYSQVTHFEGKTEVRNAQNPAEVGLFISRWRSVVENDPYYNPNLSRTRHDFALAEPVRQ